VGGKATELSSLLRRGVVIPVTWVLDVGPFRELVETELPREHEPRALLKLRKPMARMERAAQARTRLLECPLPERLSRALDVLWDRLEPLAPWGLVVRASPSVEDDSTAHMAGLSGVELGVRGGPALGEAIRRLWALVFSPRALAYLAGRKARDVAMAVLIQPLVRAEVSGVMATRPPSSLHGAGWLPGEFVVNAWWGLGPRVEGGDAACDVLRVAPDGTLIDGQIAHKPAKLVPSLQGVSFDIVPPPQQDLPCLGEEQLTALAALAERLTPAGEEETEVHFAFVEGRLQVLQAQRGARQGFPPGGGAATIWSRTTVTESLSGVVTPLTMSLSEPFVEDSFRYTFERLGCSVSEEPLIAEVHGRAYLNLSVLMRMAVQIPGLDARAVVQLVGVEGAEALEKQLGEVSRRGFYSRLPVTAARQLAEQSAIGTLVERFEASQGEEERAVEEIDLAILPDDALVPRLRELRAMLGQSTRMLAVATTAYVTAHLSLEMLLRHAEGPVAGRAAQLIAAGASNLEATRPAVALAQIATIARDEPAARAVLTSGDARRIDDLPPGPTRSALFRFLVEHGHLTHLAAELMNLRWSEDAAPLLAMLTALLHGGRSGPQATAAVRARADRERAALEQRLPLVKRLLVRGLVDRCRRLAELRERARDRFLRTLALWRKGALEIDRRLQRADPSISPGAVFFCSLDELMAAMGTGRPMVAHLSKPRRLERARDLNMPDPPTTFIGAPPAFLLPPPGAALLRGVAASSGVITGRARVLRDVARDGALVQAGEILVVKSADLGLSPLFLVAGGLVTQQGGRLTQGSVVARELGLPAVAGVPSATRALRTGDLLRIDGDKGTVERLPSP
jgi:phosphohistidine swiveling domain-containing protein